MALVAFLKGINVGGRRRFRPTELAKQLKQHDVVNVGAAGTFVVRRPVNRTQLEAEIAERLPFRAHVMICDGRDILGLASGEPFADYDQDPGIVQFVSVMPRPLATRPKLPLDIPDGVDWCVRVLSRRGQFVIGLHRREMRAIRSFGQLEKILDAPLATRNWNTVRSIARILRESGVS